MECKHNCPHSIRFRRTKINGIDLSLRGAIVPEPSSGHAPAHKSSLAFDPFHPSAVILANPRWPPRKVGVPLLALVELNSPRFSAVYFHQRSFRIRANGLHRGPTCNSIAAQAQHRPCRPPF